RAPTGGAGPAPRAAARAAPRRATAATAASGPITVSVAAAAMIEISVPSRPGQSRPSCFLGQASTGRRVGDRKRERALAGDRARERERGEVGFADQRVGQQLVILAARDFS